MIEFQQLLKSIKKITESKNLREYSRYVMSVEYSESSEKLAPAENDKL